MDDLLKIPVVSSRAATKDLADIKTRHVQILQEMGGQSQKNDILREKRASEHAISGAASLENSNKQKEIALKSREMDMKYGGIN